MKALQIEKEIVPQLQFPSSDVLIDKKDQIDRTLSLKRAQFLGNIEHTKMKIIFRDSVGLKKIHTTVWGVTDNYVILKGSNVIPLNRIVRIY